MAENSAGDEDVDMVQMIDYSIYTCEDNYEEIFKYLESPMHVCVIIEGKNGRIPSLHPKVTKDFFRANKKMRGRSKA